MDPAAEAAMVFTPAIDEREKLPLLRFDPVGDREPSATTGEDFVAGGKRRARSVMLYTRPTNARR